jgi:NADH-quinone oxidoreductase subunit E
MLTEQEKQEITEELKHVERPEAAAIEALRVVQKKRGWASDASLRDVAAQLNMTPAELDAVATFYSFIFRKPVGRHVITLCDSMVCWSLGHDGLYKLVSGKLGIEYGGTTTDNRFTLLPASCLGACDRAPAMMVDDELHGPVDMDKLDEILMNYL